MAQDDGVNLLRVKRKTVVAVDGFLAVALEQTAFEQQFLAVHLDLIHRAGGSARGAEEVDFHVCEG
jgi:DNA-binding phage protein